MDRTLDSPGAAGLRRRLDRRWTWRIASVLAALGSYYLSEWLSLRVVWQAALVAGLELIGDEAQAIWTPSGPGLWLAGERFAITRNCTYLDMLLVLSPLHWRFGSALRANLLRLAALALGLATFNQLRIMVAIHLHAVEGVSWRVAHFWPDALVHVAWITVAALFAMQADLRHGEPPCSSGEIEEW